MRHLTVWLVGILATLLLLWLTTGNLEGPGPYYDELHQAPAAFVYLGQSPTMFTYSGPLQLPVLNMSYSGAIKSNIYGMYLRATGAPFTLRSWRWLGILFVAGGLLLFFSHRPARPEHGRCPDLCRIAAD